MYHNWLLLWRQRLWYLLISNIRVRCRCNWGLLWIISRILYRPTKRNPNLLKYCNLCRSRDKKNRNVRPIKDTRRYHMRIPLMITICLTTIVGRCSRNKLKKDTLTCFYGMRRLVILIKHKHVNYESWRGRPLDTYDCLTANGYPHTIVWLEAYYELIFIHPESLAYCRAYCNSTR